MVIEPSVSKAECVLCCLAVYLISYHSVYIRYITALFTEMWRTIASNYIYYLNHVGGGGAWLGGGKRKYLVSVNFTCVFV